MPLSWNEIRKRAIEFSQEWKDATRENAEKQTFWNEFFNVFGIPRRRVASFEEPVKKLGSRQGFIDLLWKGALLVEHKSAGYNLAKAKSQALDYFPNLKNEELPKYVLVSDFQRFDLYDLETDAAYHFTLSELHKKVELFGFIAGYQKREFKDQDPVNIEAAELMGYLHDRLKDAGYEGHDLELMLVRLLFCLFADKAGIFLPRDSFRFYLEEQTKLDGSDLGMHLAAIFQTLDTEVRSKTLDESLAQFAYINGTLFERRIPLASFDSAMRQTLIRACYFDWSRISPAIFGSLFQSVMDSQKRRSLGAHYTTEMNIMKILKPLFLDELHAEFEKIKNNRNKLLAFHDKLAGLRFLDPACGCGNFLILAYRELRLLEIDVLKHLHKDMLDRLKGGVAEFDVSSFSKIDVDVFYGIEIEEFPAKVAEVALWLMDHQMNMRLSETFGQSYARIPLRKSAHIVNDNALRLDWQQVVPKNQLTYILGNPPFVGKKEQIPRQKAEILDIFHGVKGAGVLDYVTAWYIKAAQYIQGTKIKCAFVSTNSISQGEQVGILWQELFTRYHIKIQFAHRTFEWGSEARKKAHVHVVIIGFATFDADNKLLYDYDTPKSDAHTFKAININPYLVDAPTVLIERRTRPLSDKTPEMAYGSMPIDKGNLILDEQERAVILDEYPTAKKYIRRCLGSDEFINNIPRYCLWLTAVNPTELRQSKIIMDRIEANRKYRLSSNRPQTKELAKKPGLFGEIRQPAKRYLLVPKVSSENRHYIPIGFCAPEVIATGTTLIVPRATLYEFGILQSTMHMAWVRTVCGRMKSDYQYSNSIVYNNFPWPQNPTSAQLKNIEAKAQAVLDARTQFPNSSLADLYDPLSMPPVLVKAHKALDKAVDAAYRKQPFDTERHRIEYLFELYQQITAPLIAEKKKGVRHEICL